VEGENSTSGPQPYQPYEGGDYHLPYFQQEDVKLDGHACEQGRGDMEAWLGRCIGLRVG